MKEFIITQTKSEFEIGDKIKYIPELGKSPTSLENPSENDLKRWKSNYADKILTIRGIEHNKLWNCKMFITEEGSFLETEVEKV